MRLVVSVLILAFAGALEAERIFGGIGGPFRVVPRSLEQCPLDMVGKNLGTFTPYFRRSRNKPNTFFITGNITTLHDLNDKYWIHVTASSWSNRGGWTKNAFMGTLPQLCTNMNRFARKQWHMIAMDTFGYIPECPIGKGFLHLEETPVDFTLEHLTHFIYGKLRVDIQTLDEHREVMTCFRVFVDMVPANQPENAG